MLNGAVVGCGHISSRHLDAMEQNENINIVAVCDIDHDRADASAERYNAKVYYSFEEMLENEKIDVVHICTPHYLHLTQSVFALERGINVLSEKPMALSFDDALKIKSSAEKSNRKYGVCFQNRLNSSSVKIKQMIDSGDYGNVLSVKGFVTWKRDEEYFSDDWHGTKAKEGGSLCINQAIHTLDLLQWFAGSEIKSVKGSVSAKKLGEFMENEDTADALIEFENGVVGVFYGTLCFATNSPVMIEVTLERARILLYDKLNIIYDNGEVEQIDVELGKGKKGYWGNSHSTLINEFYSCVEENRPFPIDATQGLPSMKIVSEIYRTCSP